MNELLKLNDELLGLPAGGLIAIFAIALGYILKTIPFVNNRYIPLVVVSFCVLFFVMLAPPIAANTPERIYIGRNIIIGFIIGFASWTFHAQLLRRFVDPHFFNDDGSTKFFTKPPENKP